MGKKLGLGIEDVRILVFQGVRSYYRRVMHWVEGVPCLDRKELRHVG